MVAIVELPWALDVPPPVEASVAVGDPTAEEPVAWDDPGALARGILVGLGVSVPLWLGIGWLVTWLVATLPVG